VLYFQAYPGVALQLDELQRAATVLGKSLLPIEVKRPEEYPAAFEKMTQWRANAAVVIENPIFFTNREKIVALAASSNLPTVYNERVCQIRRAHELWCELHRLISPRRQLR